MWPSFGSPLALPWPIKPAPRFPATTIQLKNHLSLAVRLGMGDYKQLWKRLTGDCCLTALWPSRHYWGPFSWLSSSADRYTVVVTGNWGGGAGRSPSWLCVSSVGEIKKKKKKHWEPLKEKQQSGRDGGEIWDRFNLVEPTLQMRSRGFSSYHRCRPSLRMNFLCGLRTCQGGWQSGLPSH